MTDRAEIIDIHLAGYCEPDPERRLALLRSAWTEAGTLTDPPLEGAGPDQIAGLVDQLLAGYPGHRFERVTGVDSHHDHARYGWALVAPDGTPAVTGVDVVEFEGDRLAAVVGFFGDLPEREG